MHVIKALHVLCVFIWVGNLLALTRLMGYHVKEDEVTQRRLARLYSRMYNFVGLPTLCLSVVFGMILLTQVNLGPNPEWFYFKMLAVVPLLVCDMICGRFVAELNQKPDTGHGIKYKILHGICGLVLMAIISTIFIVRNSPHEDREIVILPESSMTENFVET